jgi:LEA14-like dessication related protein
LKRLVLIVSFWLSGCSLFLTTPEVAVKEVNLLSLDSGGVEIELNLAVTNPNPFVVKLQGDSYDLKVLTLPFARGGAREAVDFPSRSTTDMRIPVRVSYGELWEILKRHPDPNKIPYQLKGGLELQTPFGAAAVPVERNGTFAIPQKYRPDTLLRGVMDLLKGVRE